MDRAPDPASGDVHGRRVVRRRRGARTTGDHLSADLVRKLGIKAGHRVFVREECSDLLAVIAPHLPPRVAVSRTPPADGAHVVLLRPARGEVDALFPRAKRWIIPDGAVWVVVKKKPYRHPGDPSFETTQAAALPTGLVDNKECTVSETEYATRYVLRKELRPKP